MWNTPEVVREVGVDDVRVTPEQQLLHLYDCLLGVSPSAVGVVSGGRSASKIGSNTNSVAVIQTRSRTPEMPSGLSLPLAFGINTGLIGSGR
jgi:hypothetical protein